jgi:membrane-bound lytic murein transglycosylase B
MTTYLVILVHLAPIILFVYPNWQKPQIEPVVNLGVVEVKETVSPVAEIKDTHSYYRETAQEYGIPWQVLEAVHQIESGKSGDTCKKSYAGAMGPMQFMPGTWQGYKQDGNNDGVFDACNMEDALHGAANLLRAGGAADGRVYNAIFNYNHSDKYVHNVLGIARELGYSG